MNLLATAAAGLGLALASLSAAAVDLPPPAVPAQRAPIMVNDLGITARFAVDRLKTSMVVGDELGNISGGMFCSGRQPMRMTEDMLKGLGAFETSITTQLLKKYGYPMATLGSGNAYSNDVGAAPDFRIGGIIRELRFETCRTGNEAEGWIYVKIDWALYSEREQKVVFQLTSEGLAQSEKKIPELSRLAVTSAVDNFLGAPGFLAAVKPDAAALLAARAASGPAAPAPAAPRPAERGEARPPAVTALTPVKAHDQGLTVKLAVDPLKVALLQGDEMGNVSVGGFCLGSRPLTASEAFIKNYGRFIASVATQALKKNGYPLASDSKANAFDTEQAAAPDFRLGGVLQSLRMEICESGNTTEGWIHARIEWALYSEKAKRVVFQRSTEGLAFSKDKLPDFSNIAYTMSLENFLAAPEVMAALKAAPPVVAAAPAAAASAAGAASAAPAAAAPAGALQLAGAAPATGGAQKNQAKLRAAVVTLNTASGSGSGFYIDRAGYLLTNFHVVSGSRYVKVTLLNGDKLVAEVVKLSERDDVALLKSVAIDFEPLAVRPDTLEVGEEVYAIGTPLGVLTSTMTRGVLSADRTTQGVRMLQSDAAVTFGSSGGPLLDGEGRVIGITTGGVRGEKGFNFFIPIQDALRSVNVSVGKR